MYSIRNIVPWWCLCISAVLSLSGCNSREDDLLTYLTEGYWVQEGEPDAPLLHFSASGHLFYYIFTPTGQPGRYDACYDPASQQYTKYAVDLPNSRLCFLPDQWYDINVLIPSTLTLSAGKEVVKFNKTDPAGVRILSAEEYFSLYPEQTPES